MSELTTTVSDVTDETTAPLALEDAGRRVAAAQLLSEMLDAHKSEARAAYLALLVAEFEQSHGKTFVVQDPQGRKIGQAVLPESSDETIVVDKAAFADWVAEHFETEVEVVVTVRPAFQKRLLTSQVAWVEDADYAGSDPTPLIPVYIGDKELPEGETHVPGLMLRRGSVDTSSFRFTFAKPKAGAAITVDNQATGRQIVADLMDGVLGEAFGASARAQIDA